MYRVILVLALTKSAFLENTGRIELLNNDVVSESYVKTSVYMEKIKNVPANVSQSAVVRTFLKHYNSLKPIAVLVDDTKESHREAKSFIKSVFEVAPNAKYITFFLMKFNASGVSQKVEINGNDSSRFDELLTYASHQQSSYLGVQKSNGSAAFFAVLNAAAQLPHNSAILIFIDRKAADEDLASHTGSIRKKNVKVYVVWGGLYPTTTGEERLLRELCVYSGGKFIVNSEKDLSKYNYRIFLENGQSNSSTSMILLKHNLVGDSEFTFPIDSEVTGIHITITPSITKGKLTSPTGYTVDIMEDDEIAQYATGSFGITELGLREIHLNTTTPLTRGVGFWRLVLDNTHVPYDVTVYVFSRLTALGYVSHQNTSSQLTDGKDKKIVKFGISGYVTSINNISFIDKDGQSILERDKYTLVKDSLMAANDTETYQNKLIDVEVNKIPKQPFYALIQGKDSEGNNFERLTYINSFTTSNVFPRPPLTIDVGLGSELITTGGRYPEILFEVTNGKTTSADVTFYCSDTKSLLRSMQPYRKIISPQSTTTVRVVLSTRTGTYQDELTFSASIGSEVVEKKVIVDVGSTLAADNWQPDLDYSYSSDCSKVLFAACEDGTWTIVVKAKDTGSGLLQVVTNPTGLYFPNGFTTGTKEEVTGYLSDSCCSPDIQITAVDRSNNRRVVTANAYRANWSPGQIAAIVLGLLLLILIIVLVVYFIVKCLKKKDDYNIPPPNVE